MKRSRNKHVRLVFYEKMSFGKQITVTNADLLQKTTSFHERTRIRCSYTSQYARISLCYAPGALAGAPTFVHGCMCACSVRVGTRECLQGHMHACAPVCKHVVCVSGYVRARTPMCMTRVGVHVCVSTCVRDVRVGVHACVRVCVWRACRCAYVRAHVRVEYVSVKCVCGCVHACVHVSVACVWGTCMCTHLCVFACGVRVGHLHSYASLYACGVHVRMCTCIRAHLCVLCVYVHVHACIPVCLSVWRACRSTYTREHLCM